MRFLLLIFLTASVDLFAQNATADSLTARQHQLNLAYTSLYKENAEMSYTSPLGEIGAPSKYILNGKLSTTYMVIAPRNMGVAFAINPDFTARVRNDKSAGVRTPSFRLSGIFYVRLADEIRHYRYAELGFTHHSNGQDEDATLPNGEINTATGNFNTNYLTLAVATGRFTDIRNFTYFSYHHKLGFAWHKWFDFEPALRGNYGFTRVKYDFSFRIYHLYGGKKSWRKGTLGSGENMLEKEAFRFNTQLSYAINNLYQYQFFAPKKRLNIEISANYSLPFMQNVFLMASAGYYGEDPYNIYFQDKYAFARFGLSSTFSRYKLRSGK